MPLAGVDEKHRYAESLYVNCRILPEEIFASHPYRKKFDDSPGYVGRASSHGQGVPVRLAVAQIPRYF